MRGETLICVYNTALCITRICSLVSRRKTAQSILSSSYGAEKFGRLLCDLQFLREAFSPFFFFLVLTKRDKRILHETLETTLCSIRTAAQERQKKHGARQQATQSRKGAMCTYGTRGGGQATRDLVTRAVRSLGHQDSFTQQHVRLGVEQYDIQHDWLQQVLPPAHSVT